MSDGGKGSGRRPMAISDQQYQQRWDLIFGRDKNEDSEGSSGKNQECVGLEGQAERDGRRQDTREIKERNQRKDAE